MIINQKVTDNNTVMKDMNENTKKLYNIAQKRSKQKIRYKKYDDKHINFNLKIENYYSEDN